MTELNDTVKEIMKDYYARAQGALIGITNEIERIETWKQNQLTQAEEGLVQLTTQKEEIEKAIKEMATVDFIKDFITSEAEKKAQAKKDAEAAKVVEEAKTSETPKAADAVCSCDPNGQACSE